MPYKSKEMRAISSRKWYVKNIHRKMHDGAKRRAKKANIPFNITIQDITDVFPKDWICPALGVKMEVATGKNNELCPRLWLRKGKYYGDILQGQWNQKQCCTFRN